MKLRIRIFKPFVQDIYGSIFFENRRGVRMVINDMTDVSIFFVVFKYKMIVIVARNGDVQKINTSLIFFISKFYPTVKVVQKFKNII